jgi:hypothetical protein
MHEHPLGDLLFRLSAAGVIDLRYAGDGSNSRTMLWRMVPCWDPAVERVICRDLDCLPCAKDRRLVEAWIHSGFPVHAISDNPAHTGWMMGGMVGFHVQPFLELVKLKTFESFLALPHQDEWGERGGDQDHLNRHIWPHVLGEVCEHRLRGQRPDPENPPQDIEGALKTPLPDVSPESAAHSDALLNHLGQAGFDVGKAVEAFLTIPHPINEVVTRAVRGDSAAEQFLSKWEVRLD